MPYITGLPLASIAIMVLLHCSWFQNRFSPNKKKSTDAKCACPECWFQTLHKQGVQSWQRMWASGSKTFCHTLDKLIMLITVHIVSIILIYIFTPLHKQSLNTTAPRGDRGTVVMWTFSTCFWVIALLLDWGLFSGPVRLQVFNPSKRRSPSSPPSSVL